MPLWVAALIGGLIQAAGTLVGRVLISLGFGYVAYSGIDTSITWARDQALASIGQMGATVVGLAGLMQVGTALSILTSALAVRMLLNGLTGGTLRRLVLKS